MKSFTLTLTAVLAVSLCEPTTVVAQTWSQQGDIPMGMFGPRPIGQPYISIETMGMFGSRALGQPFVTGQSQGMLGYHSTLRALPTETMGVIQIGPGGNYAYSVQPNGIQVAAPLQAFIVENNPPELPLTPALAPTSLPEINGLEGVNPAGQDINMSPGIELPAASNVTVPRARMRVDSAVAARGQQFAHSRELSDRLTQIARTKGMLSGKGIKVYLSNNIALLQGAVRTPGDRVLLAYVLNLEPEVRWIDNQLVVKGSSELSANHQSP